MKQRYKRRNFFVKKKFQVRYISLILLVMFIAVLLTGYTVYATTWILFGEKLAAVYPQGLLLEIVNKVNAVLALRIFFLTPLVILIALILSHRIAGPIYSIQKFLRKVTDGIYDERLRLRKKDELHDVAESLNLLVTKLFFERETRREEIEVLKREARELKTALLAGENRKEEMLQKMTFIEGRFENLK